MYMYFRIFVIVQCICLVELLFVPVQSDVSDVLRGTVQDSVNSSIGQLSRSLTAVSIHTL